MRECEQRIGPDLSQPREIQGQPATGSSAVVLTSSPLAFLPLLVPFFVNRNGILCSLFSSLPPSLSLSLSLFLYPPFFSFVSPSPFLLFSWLQRAQASHQPFYAAHQSFLLAFLFSLLADPPSLARTHARSPPDYATRLYSSMTRRSSRAPSLTRRIDLYEFRSNSIV